MKSVIAMSVISLFVVPTLFAQQKLPTAVPLLAPSICGKGVYLFWLGEQSMGREEFETKCQPNGDYLTNGHTELKTPVGAIDLNTSLEVDKTGEPLLSTAKGTVNGKPFDQSVAIKDGTATITSAGGTKDLPFAKGTSLLGGNIFSMFQYLLARFDPKREDSQQVKVFPNLTGKLERLGRDQVQATGISASPTPAPFDRYSITVATTNVIAWVDSKGRIAILVIPLQNFAVVREEYSSFVPSFKSILSEKMKESEPDYSAPPNARFTAEEVSVDAKTFTLAGTLLLPKTGKAPYPVVVMITGSGQQTRDEFLPLPGLEKYRPFRQIAEVLADNGIAVLRVDDRGVGKSKGLETLKTATSANFADDVRAQIAYLRSRRDIDPNRIALIGHSEGGMIAPMVAETDARVAAIVLMAGTAKRGETIIAYQVDQSLEGDASLTEQAKTKARADQQEAMRKAIAGDESAPEPLRVPWTRYFLTYDPLPTIKKVKQPILVLQGEFDRQVTADQAEMLVKAARESGNKDVTVHVFPGLNHLFLPSKTGAVAEYSSLETNAIPDSVIKPLTDWLVKELKVGK